MHKTYINYLLYLAIAILQYGCASFSNDTIVGPDIKSVSISAHRGGPTKGFPENALETLKNTARQVDGIMLEIDILPTLDSVLVLMHDKTLDRTTNLKGYVKDYSLNELETGFLVDAHNEPLSMKVPTLVEVFKWAKEVNVFLSIDVKDTSTFYQVIDLIREFKILDKTEIITYSLKDAELVHNYDSEVFISVSMGSIEVLEKMLQTKINTSKVAAFTGGKLKDSLFYQKLKDHGIVVTLGTIGNLDNRAKTRGFYLFNGWLELGVERFATDYFKDVHLALSNE